MVIPHFRKGQVNGEIAVLGITKSVKKKPPVAGVILQFQKDGSGSLALAVAIIRAFACREASPINASPGICRTAYVCFWHKADIP